MNTLSRRSSWMVCGTNPPVIAAESAAVAADDIVQLKLWSSSSGLCAPTVRGMPLTQTEMERTGVETMEYLVIVGIGLIVVFIAAVRGAGKPSRRRRRTGSWQSGDGGGFGCGGGSSCGGGGGD
ncbi:hypothetical protein [Streptomyces sp. NPDC002889]|uniref:hypothetical protein n=1 Tax=Streptomyces sp. NPDC002889 TaxID=3364669 RepID=UPI0036CD2A25